MPDPAAIAAQRNRLLTCTWLIPPKTWRTWSTPSSSSSPERASAWWTTRWLFTLTSEDSTGFRRGELALKISLLYQRIYVEEERSSAEPAGLVPGLLNRTRTEGTYGIWGHGLGDLLLTEVVHKPLRDVWELEIDS